MGGCHIRMEYLRDKWLYRLISNTQVTVLNDNILYERYRSGRRHRYTALPYDKGRFKAIAAGIRQADDLLSDISSNVVGDKGDIDYLYTL